jgi:hypothetical protein
MATVQETFTRQDGRVECQAAEVHYERGTAWPINWSAVWVGALAALGAALIFGLIGVAIGAHLLDPAHRVVDLHKMAIGSLIFSVCSAFFAFVIGGWVAGKVAGTCHSEPGALHGAMSWLVATPFLVLFVALGAGSLFGGWYTGLAGTPAWANPPGAPFERPEALGATATDAERAQLTAAQAEYRDKIRQWNEETPRATRNGALGAVTALLLGLVGSVLGGWMACGEPMSFTYHRTRTLTTPRAP